MNALLKTCCLLLTPLVFANVSLGREIKKVHEFAKFGVETQVNLSKISWGLDTVSADTGSYYETAAAILNTSSIAYTSDENKQPNFGIGLSIIGRLFLSDTYTLITRFGIEPGLDDSIALRVTDNNNIGRFGSDGVLKSNYTFAPAAFLGMKGMYLGAMYEARSYETPRNHGQASANLTESVKDNHLLYGFRVEREVLVDNAAVLIGVEGMSNLVADSSDTMMQYYKDVINFRGGTAVNGADELEVTNVHTKMTKLSVTLGAAFLSL